MSRKQILVIVGLAVLAFVLFELGLFATKPLPKSPVTGLDILEKKGATSTAPMVFSPEVPKDAAVTKPVGVVTPAPSGGGSIYGHYAIQATASGFNPNSITVKKGDVVNLQLYAIDAKYDFSLQGYGNYLAVEKGGMGEVTFMPDTVGTFLFTCRDFCPASGKLQGTFIVLPK